MGQLTDQDLLFFKPLCASYHEDFENVKNACVNILTVCGGYPLGEGLLDMAVAITQSKAMADSNSNVPDRRISADNVCVVQQWKLGFDQLSHLNPEKKAHMKQEVQKAVALLSSFILQEDDDTPDGLFETWCDAHEALKEALKFLQ